MRRAFFAITMVALLVLSLPVLAQDAETDEAEAATVSTSGVEILWPPPITEVWGEGDVIGTAAVPGMAYYYLEYLPLNDDLTQPEGAPWIPFTVAIDEPVINGRLATLDTTTVPDGLYALRLVVNTAEGQSFFSVVEPLRVSNERFNQVTERIVLGALAPFSDILEDAGIDLDDLFATETPEGEDDTDDTVEDTTPRAEPAAGFTAVNVRRCDVIDNYACAIVGTLTTTGATVNAVSSTASGWYQVTLPTGQTGWVSPTVTNVSGDLSNLPRLRPPAPLPPPATANITLNGIAAQGTPTCNQTFNVQINVANIGNAASQPGSVTLQDVNTRTGDITFTGYGSFPTIAPGGNFVVVIPVATSVFYNETHELRAYVGDQRISQQYVLNQGNCGVQSTPTPPPQINQRELAPDQCFLVLTNTKVVFDTPYGNPQGRLDPAAYEANLVREANQVLWYRLNVEGFGQVWMADGGVEKQGNCGL